MRWWKAGLVIIGLAGSVFVLIWLAQDFIPIEADDDSWLQDVVWLSPNYDLSTFSEPQIAFSPDGQWLAMNISGLGEAALMSVSTGNIHRILATRGWAWTDVKAMAFTCNSQLITASYKLPYNDSVTIKVWDISRGTLAQSMRLEAHSLSPLAFSPDGRMVALSSCSRKAGGALSDCIQSKVEVWRIADGRKVRTLWLNGVFSKTVFSSDGQRLAANYCEKRGATRGCVQGTSEMWDLSNGQKIYTLSDRSGWIRVMGFSPDGKWLISTGCTQPINATAAYECTQGEIKLWRVADGGIGPYIHGPSQLGLWHGFFKRWQTTGFWCL